MNRFGSFFLLTCNLAHSLQTVSSHPYIYLPLQFSRSASLVSTFFYPLLILVLCYPPKIGTTAPQLTGLVVTEMAAAQQVSEWQRDAIEKLCNIHGVRSNGAVNLSLLFSDEQRCTDFLYNLKVATQVNFDRFQGVVEEISGYILSYFELA